MKRINARSNSPPSKRIRIRSSTPPPSFKFNEKREKQQTLEQYIQKLDGASTFNKNFSLNQYDLQFQIVNVPEDPEALLSAIFKFCIDESRKEARENGLNPDMMSITIRSTLLDPHIYLPYRSFNENTADVVLHEFFRVAQSKKQQGITLWGAPFRPKQLANSTKVFE